nr:uncharacterized protein LOC123493521 [Aegilops tauschii subsp. strangulata]
MTEGVLPPDHFVGDASVGDKDAPASRALSLHLRHSHSPLSPHSPLARPSPSQIHSGLRHRRRHLVDPVAADLPSSRQGVQELRHLSLLRLQASARARRPLTLAIDVIFAHGRRISPSNSSHPGHPRPPNLVHEHRDTEADAAATQYDYGVDDPLLLG